MWVLPYHETRGDILVRRRRITVRRECVCWKNPTTVKDTHNLACHCWRVGTAAEAEEEILWIPWHEDEMHISLDIIIIFHFSTSSSHNQVKWWYYGNVIILFTCTLESLGKDEAMSFCSSTSKLSLSKRKALDERRFGAKILSKPDNHPPFTPRYQPKDDETMKNWCEDSHEEILFLYTIFFGSAFVAPPPVKSFSLECPGELSAKGL